MSLSKEAREARNAYQREWTRNNRDKVNRYQRKWREKNPEKCKEYSERYWEKVSDRGFQQLREALGGNNNGC